MAGMAKGTIESTITDRIEPLERTRQQHVKAIESIDAQLGMARLLLDDLLSDTTDTEEASDGLQ